MSFPLLQRLILPAVGLVAGLCIGLGVGHMQVTREVTKEQKSCQDKIREKEKRIAFIQKTMTEERAEATGSLEQKCTDDVNKLQAAIQGERKKTADLRGRVGILTEQVQKLEARNNAANEKTAKTRQDLEKAQQINKDLDRELKQAAGEKQVLQVDLKRTTRELGSCSAHNAELALIAQELVKKYKDKGIGSALLEKEPLTQVRKVELEQLISQYQDEIEQLKINKK